MTFVKRTLAAAVLLACTACQDASTTQSADAAQETSAPLGEGFDFYVVALSWSPSFCATAGSDADDRQCGPEASHGFILHGLWPQLEKGYPSNCETQFGGRVAPDLIGRTFDIMPSAALIQHEWTTHGTCTGLSQADYFDAAHRAFNRIAFPDFGDTAGSVDPDEVEKSFLAANDGMPSSGVAVTCDDGYLRDVRICMTRDLSAFRPCPEVDRRSCNLPTTLMPPVN